MSNRAVAKGDGRRSRLPARSPYNFHAKLIPITGTSRKCHVHPMQNATHFEVNALDASYKRPVCGDCAK